MALATNTSPGEVQLAGDLAGGSDATAPELTATGVTPGSFTFPSISVDSKGRITSITNSSPLALGQLLEPASATKAGVIRAGIGLSVNPSATAGYQNIVFSGSINGSEGSTLNTCASYSLTISIDFGAPQVLSIKDVVLTTINDVISALNVQLSGATISIVAGQIRITSDTTGVTSGVEINEDRIFKCILNYSFISPIIKGTASCILNADLATGSQVGVVRVGSGLSIDSAGLLSTAVATTTALGTVQIGAGLNITAGGILSSGTAADATTSSKGIVQIGANIAVSAGVISIPTAENGTLGAVKALGNNIDIMNGVMDVGPGVALTTTNNQWSAAQVVQSSVLSSSNSININASLSNTFTLTLGVNSIFNNPTNLVSGGRYTFIITQDGTGNRTLTFDTSFKFKNASNKTLSTSSGTTDILSCLSDGSNLYCSLTKEFV